MHRLQSIGFSIFIALVSPSPTRAQTPGELYAPWTPGDGGVFVDKQDKVYDVCMSRDPDGCRENRYPPLGKWDRISDSVIQSPRGTYFCKYTILKNIEYQGIANCTKEGWVKADCNREDGICSIGKHGAL